MRRPRTKPLAEWENGFYLVRLHRQKIGFVLWAWNKVEGDWEWGAYEDRGDAELEVEEFYDIRTSESRLVPSDRGLERR